MYPLVAKSSAGREQQAIIFRTQLNLWRQNWDFTRNFWNGDALIEMGQPNIQIDMAPKSLLTDYSTFFIQTSTSTSSPTSIQPPQTIDSVAKFILHTIDTKRHRLKFFIFRQISTTIQPIYRQFYQFQENAQFVRALTTTSSNQQQSVYQSSN